MTQVYLVISHLKIHNANAMSSTFTIGVPAMTAWLGAVHALQRKIVTEAKLKQVRLNKAAVAYHSCDLQVVFKADRYSPSYTLIGTANPLKKKGASWERPPFIPDARIHLDVSLLVEVQGITEDNRDNFESRVSQYLQMMKFAGGDVLSFKPVAVKFIEEGSREEKRVLGSLMPGYVLVERRDLMEQEPEGDSLDTLLSYLMVSHHSNVIETTQEKRNVSWKGYKKASGYLVPIAVGFKGISTLGNVKNQRDADTPHRFAEPVVTLGEFKLPIRFDKIQDILWHYEYHDADQLYLCVNQ